MIIAFSVLSICAGAFYDGHNKDEVMYMINNTRNNFFILLLTYLIGRLVVLS